MKSKFNVDKKLAAGIVCGVIAAIMMSIYLSDARAEALSYREDAIRQYGGETVQVCVAKRDISSGKTISQQDVELKTWIADLLPENAATKVEEIVGQTAQQTIMSNEPISKSKVGAQHLEISVPDGLCAVSVPSQDVQSVGGTLKPGDTVNVYAVGGNVSLIGQNILVLETSSSGTESEKNSSTFGSASSRSSVTWVTLAVTPDSVEQLIAASKSGNLYFALPSESKDIDANNNANNTNNSANNIDASVQQN